jgi:hypothetical protein
MKIEDGLFYIRKDIRLTHKFVTKQPFDILSQYSNPDASKENQLGSQGRVGSPQSGSVSDLNFSLPRSRLGKAANSLLASLSISGVSGRSSVSSQAVHCGNGDNLRGDNLRGDNLRTTNKGTLEEVRVL